jgi:hypothetical protein
MLASICAITSQRRNTACRIVVRARPSQRFYACLADGRQKTKANRTDERSRESERVDAFVYSRFA